MKKIYVDAYLVNNLGDDLFVDFLVKRYPQIDFYFCEPLKYIAFLNGKSNIKHRSKINDILVRILRKILKGDELLGTARIRSNCEAIIKIGGSIFIEFEDHTYHFYGKGEKQRLYILGANFGPYYTDQFKKMVEDVICLSDDTCFRDKWSYNLFSELKPVRYAPDILWGYNLPKVIEKKKSIAISLIDLTWRDELGMKKTDYIQRIVDLCLLLTRDNYSISLYGFCRVQGDEKAIDEVINLHQNNNFRKVIYSGNIDSFLRDYCANEYYIATRFHAAILAWNAGKKVLPVVYSNKMENVLQDIQYKGYIWDLRKDDTPDAIFLKDALINSERPEKIDECKELSKLHFKKLDEYLTK